MTDELHRDYESDIYLRDEEIKRLQGERDAARAERYVFRELLCSARPYVMNVDGPAARKLLVEMDKALFPDFRGSKWMGQE